MHIIMLSVLTHAIALAYTRRDRCDMDAYSGAFSEISLSYHACFESSYDLKFGQKFTQQSVQPYLKSLCRCQSIFSSSLAAFNQCPGVSKTLQTAQESLLRPTIEAMTNALVLVDTHIQCPGYSSSLALDKMSAAKTSLAHDEDEVDQAIEAAEPLRRFVLLP